jgi:copper resistance protein B
MGAIRIGAAGVAAALLALGGGAEAQRLDYRDLSAPTEASAAPRLGYAAMEDEALAAPTAADEAPASAEAGSGAVREFYFDQMETALAREQHGYAWDVAARIGGPRHRLWLGSIGEGTLGGSLDYLELQALYSRAISPTWDVQAGLRFDARL